MPPVVAGDSGWSWSAANPNQITSTPSGTIFPNANPAYPIQTQAVTVMNGNVVNVPFYNRAGSSGKSLVFALIDYRKRAQLRSDLNKLAPAYMSSGASHTTRNQNYARRIAIALLDWARWFPNYYMTGKNSASFINTGPAYILPSDLQRASDHNGLAHEWADDELLAFDAIYDSVALTNLSVELGFDVRGYIRTNLFCNEGDFIVYHVPVDVATDSNLSGPYTVLALVARVLNRPDYIGWMDSYLNTTVREKIRRDGTLSEGISYSVGYINENLGAARNTRDYFLSRPADTPALQAISNRVSSYVGTLQYGQAQWHTVRLPNGELPSFGDTTFGASNARNAGNSSLLPAYGTLCLGAGSGSQAVQLNQNFSGDNNHMRSDTTAFVLWAFNNEILGNIRYHNGTPGRQFTEQILAYNAVTIDRADMSSPDADTYGNADLTLYEPGNNGLALTEIDGQRAYANKASRYQRIMLLNTIDLARPYVVDVFRVTGGTTHDYVLHGSLRFDQTFECSFPLVTNPAPYPMLEGSEVWSEPTSSGDSFPYYGFWRNVSSNQAPGNFQITYRDTSASNRDLRLWMTDEGTARVYIGRTPVPSRSNGEPENFWVNNLWRPSAIIRKRISSGTLSNLFVSVIEPFNSTGNSSIQSVERVAVNGSPLEACGLKITFLDGRVDTCIVNLRNPQVAGASGGSATVTTSDGRYSLNGRVGVHMEGPSLAPRVWTMHATDFQYPNRRFTTPTNIFYGGVLSGETRKLAGGGRDAFITMTPLPSGTALQNKQLSLIHGTLSGSGTVGISEMFRIDQVQITNGQTQVLFTNDHMLEITNGVTSVEQMAPLRTFTGSNSFEIVLSAAAGGISALPDVSLPVNGSAGPLSFSFGNLGATPAGSLQVLAFSSNPGLISSNGLTLGGTGASRTLTIQPAPDQAGSASITIAVTDGQWTNSRSFNVVVSDFLVTASPLSRTVAPGGTNIDYLISISTNGGFDGSVALAVSGVPANTGFGFNPALVNGAGNSVLSLITSNSTPSGTYLLNISGVHNGLTNSTQVTLNIVRGNAELRWASTASSAWDVTNSFNWFNPASGIADRFTNGDTVLFDDSPGLVNSVSIQTGGVLPASVTNDSSTRHYTISGPGAIGGAAGLVKKGSSMLTLAAANSFGGSVAVQAGTLRVGDNAALGTIAGGTTVAAGATLDLNHFNIGLEPVTVAGGGVGGNGALVDNSGNASFLSPQSLAYVTLAGNTTFGGSGRWDLRSAVTTTTNAALSTSGNPYKLTKMGTNQVSLVSVVVDPLLGDIEVQSGIFSVEKMTTTLGNPGFKLTVLGGATLQFYQVSNVLNKPIVCREGATILNNNGTNTYGGPVELQGQTTFNAGGTWLRFTNLLSGTGSVVKIGSGTLFLSAPNTYSGSTLVNAGTLALTNSGSIFFSTQLIVAAGATLSASGRSDGRLTLFNGQTLKGDGLLNGSLWVNSGAVLAPGTSLGTFTVTNSVTLQGTTFMELNRSASTNDLITGAAAINYGGTLRLTNLSGTLTAGDNFKLFNAGTYSGMFAALSPPTPGPGLVWNTNSLTNGILWISAAPGPWISSVQVIGTQLHISGSNGVPTGSYYVLASADLNLPLTNWTRVTTNAFDSDGAFNFTAEMNAGIQQRFFLLQNP